MTAFNARQFPEDDLLQRGRNRCRHCGSLKEWSTDGDGGLVQRCNCGVHARLPGKRAAERKRSAGDATG